MSDAANSQHRVRIEDLERGQRKILEHVIDVYARQNLEITDLQSRMQIIEKLVFNPPPVIPAKRSIWKRMFS